VISANVVSLPDGTMGCDVTIPLNYISAQQYANKGYGFIVRYVGRGDGSKNFIDLTQEEGQVIVAAGLALGIVQHPLDAGWSPTALLGQRFGAAAAGIAGGAGMPVGVTIWLDLEGVAPGAQPDDVIAYCNQWYDEVSAVGYVPGLYIGANPGLSADQLYWDVSMQSYWQGGSGPDAGVPADIPNRGYQMKQRITGSGTSEVDSDVTHADNFGGTVLWCAS